MFRFFRGVCLFVLLVFALFCFLSVGCLSWVFWLVVVFVVVVVYFGVWGFITYLKISYL